MEPGLNEEKWDSLLHRIHQQTCTPFLGAGACFGSLPLGKEIAQTWAEVYHYPFEDSGDLPRVAQFLAIQSDPIRPKERVLEEFIRGAKPPDFNDPCEPHRVLAELPLAVYMTTNYDSFLMQALCRNPFRKPTRELYKWHEALAHQPSRFESEPTYQPDPANPVVFHLHGHDETPESLVLTEDDYLTFLANMASRHIELPAPIHQALAENTLLFVGYGFNDWNFRVLIQSLSIVGRSSIAVLLPPTGMKTDVAQSQRYLEQYYQRITKLKMEIYWGTARDFAAELRERWTEFQQHS